MRGDTGGCDGAADVAAVARENVRRRNLPTGRIGGHLPVGQQLWRKDITETATAPATATKCATTLIIASVAQKPRPTMTGPFSSFVFFIAMASKSKEGSVLPFDSPTLVGADVGGNVTASGSRSWHSYVAGSLSCGEA